MSVGEIGLRIGRTTCSVWIAQSSWRLSFPWRKRPGKYSVLENYVIVIEPLGFGVELVRSYRVEQLSATLRAAFNDKTNAF